MTIVDHSVASMGAAPALALSMRTWKMAARLQETTSTGRFVTAATQMSAATNATDRFRVAMPRAI